MSLLAIEVREGKVTPLFYVLCSTLVQIPIVCLTSAVTMALFHAFGGAPWETFGYTFLIFAVFLFVYEALAEAFSTTGVAAGMMSYMFLVDQFNSYNGVYSPIHDSPYPFRFISAISPPRQMLTAITYLRYSQDSRAYEGASQCKWLDTDPYCNAGASFYCPGGQPCFGRTGKEILASLSYQGFDTSDTQVGPRICILIFWIVLFKLISVLRLYMKAIVSHPRPALQRK